MSKKSKTALRTVLLVIYTALIVLLLPWLPIAVWSVVFLHDPLPKGYDIVYFLFGKVIPLLILLYPIFLIHGIISSWRAMKNSKSSGLVVLRAAYPVLSIIPVLLIVTVFLGQ